MFMPGVQLVGDAVFGRRMPDAVRLGPADVPAMLELVARTRPGPSAAAPSRWAPTWASGEDGR